MDEKQLDLRPLEELSDDELSNLSPAQLAAYGTEEPAAVEPQAQEETIDPTTEELATPQVEEVEEPEVVEQAQLTDPEVPAPQAEVPPAEVTTPEPQKSETPPTDEVDYKGFYEQVTASFKANGRDVQFQDPGEIISLMQRGANYAKKMATLKPSMRVLRTLENHGITEDKLGYLIDLHNKNPEAINKLIKESGVDVYSLDAEKADNYQPQVALASDKEVELDEVVRDLTATSTTFQQTLDVVANKWDMQSRQFIVQNPKVLELLDTHKQLGYFDLVTGEVERLRMIGGHIDGLSDFDAYRQVGDAMNARGAFNHIAQSKPSQDASGVTTPLAAPVPVAPPQPKPELNAQRRAAGAPKPVSAAPTTEPDYAAMSDDELLAALSPRR